MSSLNDDNNCDFSILLKEIREAIDASTYPTGIHHDQPLTQEAKITDIVGSQESNNIMNKTDRHLIEEQICILQQIERYKTLSAQDPSIPSSDENLKLSTSQSDEIVFPDLPGSYRVGIGSCDEDMSNASDEQNKCDYSKLLQDIREALDTSTAYPGIHRDQHLSQQETNIADNVSSEESNNVHKCHFENMLIMNEQDKQMIEEQFRILQQFEHYKTHSSTNITQDQSRIPSNDEDPSPRSNEEAHKFKSAE